MKSGLLFLTQNIQAYIDAGTGGLIIQFLIAGFVASLFLLKVFWGKVRAFGGKALKGGLKGGDTQNKNN